jgi:hypothetical protein
MLESYLQHKLLLNKYTMGNVRALNLYSAINKRKPLITK